MTNEAEKPLRKPRKKSEKQLLIEALLGLGSDPSTHRAVNWTLEMRWLCQLIKLEPDIKFWFFFARHYRFVSLMHLLSQKNLIFKVKLEYTKQFALELKKPEEHKLAQEKVGEDIIVPKKPKTLLDFIS